MQLKQPGGEMFEKCLFFNLSTLGRKITKVWQDEFATLGLSPSHGYLLSAISANPGATQKELGELLELDASTVVRFIDALAAKGLVERTGRGRGSALAITRAGKNASRRVDRLMERLYTQMQGVYGRKQLQELVGLLSSAKEKL